MDIIHIDGSTGEGGGQVLRTAATLAARAGVPVEVTKIRANRPNPGLRPQHLAVLHAVADACSGELQGAVVGSDHVRLDPGPLTGGTVRVDTGTAGSTTLILQALLALAPAIPEPLDLELRGGTDTRWAPTLIHLRDVLLPTLARVGVHVELREVRHGFYPKGGGMVRARIRPAPDRRPLVLVERGALEAVEVTTRIARLPDHVAERVTRSAKRALQRAGHTVRSSIERVEADSPGVVVDAVARFEHAVLGANALGERGTPSEVVGRRCGEGLAAELASGATLDVHTADQVVPLVADVPGSSFVVRDVTGHLETNIEVVARFLDVNVDLAGLEDGVRVTFGG